MDNDKPHFAHRPAADSNSTSAGTKGGSQTNAPPVDPDRPTLHQRSDTAGTPSDAGTTTATNSAPSVDPDRPILHKPTESSSSGAPETASDAIDPDRPHLEYGRPADLESLDGPSPVEIAKLSGHPENLEEIAAVSDARTPETHSYAYSWTDLDDKAKMQTALEAIAQKLVAQFPQNVTKPVTNSASRKTIHRAAARKAVKPALPAFTDEQFNAYELSYGGGATLVFSATSGQGDAAKYITLIAQPDL